MELILGYASQAEFRTTPQIEAEVSEPQSGGGIADYSGGNPCMQSCVLGLNHHRLQIMRSKHGQGLLKFETRNFLEWQPRRRIVRDRAATQIEACLDFAIGQ